MLASEISGIKKKPWKELHFFSLRIWRYFWRAYERWSRDDNEARFRSCASLRASSHIWAREASRATTRERAARPRGTAPPFRDSSRLPLARLLFTISPKWSTCYAGYTFLASACNSQGTWLFTYQFIRFDSLAKYFTVFVCFFSCSAFILFHLKWKEK